MRQEGKQTQEELLLKDAAMAHSTNPIVITDADGVLRYVNAAWERLHGYQASEVLGRTAFELWPDEASAFAQALGQDVGGVVEREIRRKDGSSFVVQASVSTVSDRAGEAVAVLITEVDVSERRRSEETLREQLDELHRWHEVMLDREERVSALKREVNELCRRLGEPVRYASQDLAVEADDRFDCRATGADRPAIAEASPHDKSPEE